MPLLNPAPLQTEAIPSLTLRRKFEEMAANLGQRPFLLIALMTVFYLGLVSLAVRKGFSFDELFTYYIAQQPTIAKLLNANHYTDLNPPLLYVVVRMSQYLFGNNEVATRLPSLVGFWVGSIAFFVCLAKRTGYLASAGAIAMFWSGFFILYAIDARPYGLLLGFFGCGLYCWDILPTTRRPLLVTAILLLSTTAMMLSHVLAPFSILPLCAGQLIRSIFSRRVGWLVWIALLLPMSLELAYIHWVHQFEKVVFPSIFQATLPRMVRFYGRLAHDVMYPLIAATLAGLAATRWSARPKWAYRFSKADIAIGASLFLLPFGIIAALARTHGAFHFRYAIIGSLILWTVYSLIANTIFRNQPLPAVVFVFVLLATAFGMDVFRHWGHPLYNEAHPLLANLKPELPLVAGSGLTFLELDHYESPALTARLVYLTDREYAVKYANATLWEGYRGLKRYFPIRGKFENYRDFIAKYPHFIVFGDKDYIEDWLLKRISHDPNFKMKVIARLNCCYKDADVYEVQKISDSPANQ